ncbi:MAG: hypothetical protein [Bacteriophage sp.]|nr:MAG: hypothetical protein [Bacteriophage sp.]
MADNDCIIVHEQVVVPEPVVVGETVSLPGEKGDKGDPFTYDDFTPEQIADLQRPATEAAKVANEAAEKANKAVTDIKVLGDRLTAEEAKRESAESGRASAESDRAEAEALRESSFSQMQTTLEGLISDTNTATSNANTAAGNAENAATEANNSATLANAAAEKANQAAESVDGKYFQDNIFIPFYKCSFTNGHLDTEFAIPINGDLEDLFVISFYNIASSWIKRVKKGNTIWEIKQNIYIGREYRHTINNDVLFYEGYAFVRGRITGLAKIDLNDGSLEFNKEVITEYENISLYNNYIVATGEKKILIIEPINFSVYKQIDIDSSTYSITSYNDRVLISAGKKLYIIKDIDSEIHTIEGESIISSFYIKYLINNDIDCYLLYDKGGTRLVAEDNSFDVKSSDECFNTVGFNPLYSLNYKNYAGNAIIFIICNIGYLTLKGFIGSISLLCKNNDCPTYSKLEEISKYFLEDGYVRRIGDIMYKVKIGYDTN